MTFEGKAKWFWRETSNIELITLYVHPKNSNHLRSHSRSIMALDHSGLGLENKILENISGRIFCVRQVYFTKSCQQFWGCVNQPSILFIHHIWGETVLFMIKTSDTVCSIWYFIKRNCTQSIFRTINPGLLAKPFVVRAMAPITKLTSSKSLYWGEW